MIPGGRDTSLADPEGRVPACSSNSAAFLPVHGEFSAEGARRTARPRFGTSGFAVGSSDGTIRGG